MKAEISKKAAKEESSKGKAEIDTKIYKQLMRAVEYPATVFERRQEKDGDKAPDVDALLNATSLIPASVWEDNNCQEICEPGLSLTTPFCTDGRYAPEYHEICRCLMEFKCCAATCPPIDQDKCEQGMTIPQQGLDCCGCPIVKCEPCPVPDTPVCNSACEELGYTTLAYTQCRVPFCKRNCPTIEKKKCPKCQESEFVKNKTLCGCFQHVCRNKTCDVGNVVLVPRPCFKTKVEMDDCGCMVSAYSTLGVCDEKNNKTDKQICNHDYLPSHCHFKSVSKDDCGCNDAMCVRKTENCVHKFPASDVCPVGHYLRVGTTPCGLDRDICLKCEDTELDENKCNKKCNDVVEERNKNDCRVKRCIPKPCLITNPKCSFCTQMVVTSNECGCSISSCQPKCPQMERSDCKGGPSHSISLKDECGCDRIICLPRAKEAQASSIGSYFAANAELTWKEADLFCKSKGGYLTIIASQAEELLIRHKTPNYKENSTYWVGGKCYGGDGREKCLDDYFFDMQLIVDISGSVTHEAKPMMKAVADGLIDILKIEPDKDRVGLLTYRYSSNKDMIEDITLLGAINNKEELKDIIKTVAGFRGTTNTAAALNRAFDSFKKLARKDNTTIKICLVFTDGGHSDTIDLKAARNKWLKEGVLLIAIGYGDAIQEGLTQVTGSKSRTLMAPEIAEYENFIPKLAKYICKRLTAMNRFVWSIRDKEYSFKDVAYPPIDISGEDEGCTGPNNGMIFTPSNLGWDQLDVEKDANGAICELQVEGI